MNPCPSLEQLQQYRADQLTLAEQCALEEHISICPNCWRLLADLQSDEVTWRRGLAQSNDTDEGTEKRRRQQAERTPLASGHRRFPGVPGYEFLGELGRGGFGIVYKVRHVRLNRIVALKMILVGGMAGLEERRRFLAEAEAIAAIEHPGIVRVFDFGTHDDLPFFSLEFCPGGSLARRLKIAPLPAPEAAGLVEQVAHAVQAAHERGIVHRDLKPSNILLSEDGSPKITDFGIAKRVSAGPGLTASDAILGTPAYMAPEQAAGKSRQVGPLADVYALGAILYECLSGRPPFQGARTLDILALVVAEEPATPRLFQPLVPRDLETICLKCLQKTPASRYASAAALAEDLRRFLAREPILARPVGTLERVRKWIRRRPAAAALVAVSMVAVMSLLGGGAWFTLKLDRARRDAQTAERTAQEEARQSNKRLARLYVSTGNNCADSGDWWTALLWYNRASELDHDPDAEAHHRQRLAAILDRCAQLVGICFHEDIVLAAAVNPSGQRILTRTKDRACLWNPQRSELLAELRHEGGLLEAAFNSAGKQVATCGRDGKVQVWDAADGKLLVSLSHPAAVNWAAFNPDGSSLASACSDGRVRVWKTGNVGFPPLEIAVGAAALFLVFSPDGSRLLTVDGNDKARVWNAATGQPLSLLLPHRMQPAGMGPLARVLPSFSSDGRWVLTVYNPLPNERIRNASVHFWQADGETKSVKLAFGVNQVAFSPDGKHLLAVGSSTRADILQVPDGKLMQRCLNPREVQRGCFSPDGQLILAASSGGIVNFWTRQTTAKVAAAASAKLDMTIRHVEPLTQLTFTPDGRYLLTAGHDGTARLWQLPPTQGFGRPYDFRCGSAQLSGLWLVKGQIIALSPDARREIRIGKQPGAQIFGRPGGEPGPVLKHEGIVRDAKFSADGRRVLTVGEKEARVWDAEDGRAHGPAFGSDFPLFAVRWSRDGKRLATADVAGIVSLWEVDTGRRLLESFVVPSVPGESLSRKLPQKRPNVPSVTRLTAVDLSENGEYLAAAAVNWPTGVWVTDVAAGTTVHAPSPTKAVLSSLAMSPDGKFVLTASSDTTARVWDSTTGSPAGPPLHHPTFVRSAAFSKDGRYVVTGDSAANVRVWDGYTGDLLVPPLSSRAIGEPRCIWFSENGRQINVRSLSGKVMQWDMPSLTVPAPLSADLMRLLSGREIDETEGITFLDHLLFRKDTERFRNAWLAFACK
jgi:WD40 repeat protein/serine/threonine protein kinase